MSASPAAIALSIVCPAHNEQSNLERVVNEITSALTSLHGQYELIIVDDGSTDDTANLLRQLVQRHAQLRAIRLHPTKGGRPNGQSAAMHAGIHASRGMLVATMDADGQNDPADLHAMLELMQRTDVDMVQGDRTKSRADGLIRKFSSWIGRMVRRILLGDTIRDTGCSLRLMRRHVALALPLHYRGMHRFIPITTRRAGFTVIEVPVRHRPRNAGRTKYGMWNRALPGLIDCFAVRWMLKRGQRIEGEEIR